MSGYAFRDPVSGEYTRWQSLGEIARDWWTNQRAEPSDWTIVDSFLSHRTMRGTPDCLELIQALVAAAEGSQELLLVGAGPLEDLIVEHGIIFVDQLERCARQDETFRVALSGVWMGVEVASQVRQRLSVFGASDLVAGNRANQ